MIRNFASSIALAALMVLGTVNGAIAQFYTGAQSLGVPLVMRPVAERAGLTRSWVTQLPIDGARSKVTRIRYYDGLILAVTDEGMLHVVDAETGALRWSFQAGDRNTLTLAAGANANRVAVANTAFVYVLDRASGDLVFQRHLTGTPERGPVLTAHHVILPIVRGPLEVYDLDRQADKDTTATYLPSAGRVIGHPAVSDISIAWAGDLNRMHAHEFADLGTNIDVAVPDGISTGAVIFFPYIYMGTEGGFLMAYDAQHGDEVWRFSTGSPIRELPMALGAVVYVLPEDGGMFAVAAKTGERLWYAPDPRKFISASPLHVYALDAFGRVTILDAKSGARVATMPIPRELQPLANEANDRLMFYTERGLLQCLHEPQLKDPATYVQPKPSAPAKGPVAAPADASPPAEGAAAPPADAAPAAAPVVAPAAAPPAAEAAPAPGDNPFGN
jgi:outer membrane protein assembly factor BamB